ncbi:Gfo/Idh/MocA family protein [Caldicellulosiruptoraceae bacterium PP1]
MDKLKFALIGCGRISSKHAEAFANNYNDIEVSAFCDISLEKAVITREKYYQFLKNRGIDINKEIPVYSNYTEMLEKEKIDVVNIATYSGLHAKHALDCLEYDKHVIVEKPMALSLYDADQMIKKAEEKNKVLAVCLQNRFNKSVQKLKRSIEEGKFGKILYAVANIRWNRNDEYYKSDSWRGTWELDGGALMNQCTHNIDLLQWIIGDDVSSIFGDIETFLRNIEAEDTGFGFLKFNNGSRGIIEGTTCTYPTNLEETLSIFGESATAVLGGTSVNRINVWRVEGENEQEVINSYLENPDNVYGFGHTPLFKDIINAIRNNTKPLVTGQEGKKSLEIILGIYKSSIKGTPVNLPLGNYSTLDVKKERQRYINVLFKSKC